MSPLWIPLLFAQFDIVYSCGESQNVESPPTTFSSLLDNIRGNDQRPLGVSATCWDHILAFQEITDPLFPRLNKSETWAWKSEF